MRSLMGEAVGPHFCRKEPATQPLPKGDVVSDYPGERGILGRDNTTMIPKSESRGVLSDRQQSQMAGLLAGVWRGV